MHLTKLYDYKEVEPYEVREFICKAFTKDKFSTFEKEDIDFQLGHYKILKRTTTKENKQSTNLFYRLSIPIYLLITLLHLIIIGPIKFIFTGKFYYKESNKFGKFMWNWYQKLGI
jgi:hypothetical protein